MLKLNKKFDDVMNKLNNEYNDVIISNFKKNIKDFKYEDIADNYSKDAVTYGDSKVGEYGNEIPLDLILTAHYSYCSR
jgi:hypothetical protein